MFRWFPLVAAACHRTDDVSLPQPTGPYPVGVTSLAAFYATAWYPAEAGTGLGAPEYASGPMLAFYGMAPGDMGAVAVHAEIGALPAADGDPRPLVVFGPGGASYVDLSTSLALELASHGYVVITVQPDAYRENGFNAGAELPAPDRIEVLERVAFDARAEQLSQAIDLAGDPDTTLLVGPVNLERIAVGGHSIGGDVAVRVAALDPRIDAAFDLDGALHDETRALDPEVPVLVVMAELATLDPTRHTPDVQAGHDTLTWLETADNAVAVGLQDAGHYAVTDLPYLLPALPPRNREDSESAVGAIGEDGTTDVNVLVQRFLAATLGDEPALPDAESLAADLPGVDADPL